MTPTPESTNPQPYITDGYTLNNFNPRAQPISIGNKEYATVYGATVAINALTQALPNAAPFLLDVQAQDTAQVSFRHGSAHDPKKDAPLYLLLIRSKFGSIQFDAGLVYEFLVDYAYMPDLKQSVLDAIRADVMAASGMVV